MDRTHTAATARNARMRNNRRLYRTTHAIDHAARTGISAGFNRQPKPAATPIPAPSNIVNRAAAQARHSKRHSAARTAAVKGASKLPLVWAQKFTGSSAPAMPANTPEERPSPPATATAGRRANPAAAAADPKTVIASAPRAPVPNISNRIHSSIGCSGAQCAVGPVPEPYASAYLPVANSESAIWTGSGFSS